MEKFFDISKLKASNLDGGKVEILSFKICAWDSFRKYK